MMNQSVKKRGNRCRRAWAFLLLSLWLSIRGISFAEGGTVGARAVWEKSDVRYAVDFSYLWQVNPEGVAWLYQPETTINQPVLFSEDAAYYLRQRFDGRVSSSGSIFVTGEAPPDFSDPVVTLYGKNCYDNFLFGSLSEYRDDAYYQENPTLYLLTPDGDYRLDIFAGIRTTLSDTESWRPSSSSTQALFRDELPRILESSFIQPDPSLLPTEADAWAVLATEDTAGKEGVRYVLYARKRPIAYETDQTVYVNQLEMDSRDTLTAYVSVEGVGEWLLYAQNDPLWSKLTFEAQNSSKRRGFGDGGCGPTAVAMALAYLVEAEELPKLSQYASSPYGYRFCTCSVNDYWCNGRHLPYQLTTPEEYLRYLPLAIANFATGNNIWGIYGRYGDGFGTNMHYLDKLFEIFDISVTQTNHMDEVLAALPNEGTIAIACTSGYGSPFTSTSHFLVLAGVDDSYLYLLDPMQRQDYQTWDRNGYIEVLTPGLVRITLENASRCNLAPIYLLQRTTEQP